MRDNTDNRYPLHWPAGWLRERRPRQGNFDRARTFHAAHAELERNLSMMRASCVVLSTNLRLRLDGVPYSGQPQPADTGVAIYFERSGKPYVLAADRWDRVECNIWALAKHIEALRGQERWGVGTAEQAFAGYTALPPAREAQRGWREVFGLSSDTKLSSTEMLALVDAVFKRLARTAHPDAGGSHEAMSELNQARMAAEQEIQSWPRPHGVHP
jgi:hypothetical protein